ncbi:MAG: hypothetical protein LOD91_11290, partial [Limnochordales bacterium]
MTRWAKPFVWALVCSLLLIPVVAPAAAAAEIDRVVTVAGSQLVFTRQNPIYYSTDAEMQYYPLLWMTLTWQNTEGGYDLWLAKEFTMNNQCNIVYIELHPEARWSDGTPLTTADVAFTMK